MGELHDATNLNAQQPGSVHDGSLQPHNTEAEEAVLGIILYAGTDALEQVKSLLKPSDFYGARNAHLFTAFLHLRAKGSPINQISVTTHLKELESLDEVGPAYLSHLVANAPPPVDLTYYADLIKEASQKRRLNQIGVRLAGDSHNGVKSKQITEEAIESLESLLGNAFGGDVRDEKLPQLQITALSEVEAEVVHWLWEKWLPLGKQSVLAGDPGLGKSYLALDIAARVSWGGPLPPWMEEGKE